MIYLFWLINILIKKKKKIFYDKDNQLNLFDAKILINILKIIYLCSKKRKKILL